VGTREGATPTKIDLWEEHRDLYTPSSREPALIKVPALIYLMVDGRGDPNTTAGFRDGIGALYALAYTVKFMLKKNRDTDFRVMPLSGRYHAEDPATFLSGSKKDWSWTLMMPVPAVFTLAVLRAAREACAERPNASPALPLVRRESLREGLCAQIMHVGPYAEERPTIEKLHAFIREHGLTFAGSHHEIYLSDPNRSAPGRMKTIVRQPVAKP
jgi:hypothetical protein